MAVGTGSIGADETVSLSAPAALRVAIATYLISQLGTAVIVALVAVSLVMQHGWELPTALAFAIPAGYPLMLSLMAAGAWALRSLELQRELALVPVMASGPADEMGLAA